MSIFNAIRRIKRFIVLVVGYSILAVGIALLVLPGPAFVVIPIGLAVLATEVKWAQKLLDRLKGYFESAREAARQRKKKA
jgi:tellurite resistance protein TerC